MAALTYSLSIASKGIYVQGDDGAYSDLGTTPVWVSNGQKTVVVYSNMTMDLSLYAVSFHRKVYEPGHIQAELLIETDRNVPSVDLLELMLNHRPVKLLVGETTVAEKYYIHEITPQFESETRKDKKGNDYTHFFIYVMLDIFSMDKLLSLNKYSRAYLGQRLVGDIVSEGLQHFKLSYEVTTEGEGVTFEGDDLTLEDSGKCKLQKLEYLAEVKYTKSSDNTEETAKIPKEFIHPYLVQYNESFHDFLARTANRCGEVFYFENGHLCFGLSRMLGTWRIQNASRVVFQRISDDPLKVNDYARDSVKERGAGANSCSLGKDVIISDPVEKNSEGFPKEAFPKANDSGFAYYRNSETASEDHYLMLYKDKFARDKDYQLWWGDTTGHLLSMLSDVLNSTTLIEVLASWAVNMVTAGIRAGINKDKDTKEGNDLVEEQREEDDRDYAVMYTKVDNNADHWITLKYYSDIRNREEEQMRKMVCVDMGEEFVSVKLGSKIHLPFDEGKTYVVVGIDMTAGIGWQRQYDDLSAGNSSGLRGVRPRQSQLIYAIPMRNDGTSDKPEWTFYPPVLPGKPFRESGPQPAFIIDSKDPTGQGRVRIRFPWQPSIDDENKTVKNLEKKIDNEAIPNRKKAKGELEKYADKDSIKEKAVEVTAVMIKYEVFKKNDPEAAKTIDEAKYKDNYNKALDNYEKKIKAYLDKKTGVSEQEMEDARRELEKYAESKDINIEYHIIKADKKTGANQQTFDSKLSDYQTKVRSVYDLEDQLKIAKVNKTLAEAGTPWIRMATPMATSGGGMYFRPEVGDEVMVDFENGNVERPYVVGNLYSKNVTAPKEGSRVIVSKNGHTIKMSDPNDGTLFLAGMYPGLKFLRSFSNDVSLPFLKDNMNEVLGGIELTDKYGLYNIKMSSHDRRISISSPFGDVSINAFTGISIKAPNGDISITGKNVNISAYNKVSIRSGKNIKANYYKKTGGKRDRAGYFTIDPKELGKTIAAKTLAKTVGQFFDLSLLRTILEVFIRPVDGTLQIQSNRYLLLEAGDGGTGIETANYDTRWTQKKWDAVRGKDRAKKRRDALPGQMQTMSNLLSGYEDKYWNFFNALSTVLGNWRASCAGLITAPASEDLILKDLFQMNPDILTTADGVATEATSYITQNITYSAVAQANAHQEQDSVQDGIESLLGAVLLLKKHVAEYETVLDNVFDPSFGLTNDIHTILHLTNPFVGNVGARATPTPIPLLNPVAEDANPPVQATPNTSVLAVNIAAVKEYINNGNVDAALFTNPLPPNTFDSWLKITKRRIACLFVEYCRGHQDAFKFFRIAPAEYAILQQQDPNNPSVTNVITTHPLENFNQPFSDNDWRDYKREIRFLPPEKEKGFLSDLKSGLFEGIQDSVSNVRVIEENVWTAQAKGQILFSDQHGKTHRFKNEGVERYDNPDRDLEELLGDTSSFRNSLNF